jgi:hypothetical protein
MMVIQSCVAVIGEFHPNSKIAVSPHLMMMMTMMIEG